MDRLIEVKVCGSHLTKDSNKAGTKGEANMTRLRITFDENWEDYAKSVIFWDAYGQNPVKIVLGVNLIEDITKSTRVYLVPIPAEAMARAGYLTFSIQGSLGNKNQVSITSKLEVNDSPDILDPLVPTPSELEQMQVEIEEIKDDLSELETARRESAENAELAKESADKAVATVGKSSYIGDNGNWYAWDEENSEFYDTGVKAQAGSTVYTGSNPPEEADVWINPNENNVLYFRNANGEFIPIPTIAGKDGKSAYELAVESGYAGSLEQFTTLLNNLTYTIEADHMSDTNNPHKVTARQVGALPIEGGTITGPTIGLGNGNGQVIGGSTYSAILAETENGTKKRILRVINPSLTSYPLSKAVQLDIVENGTETEYNLYGEHNKPTSSDVGALPITGGTMTGPLIIAKNTPWSNIVLRTPSNYYRAFETDDSRVRIDVRDDQLTTKRRYVDIYTNTAESRHSHALRFGRENDGVDGASYILHTENINNFVVSNASYTGDGNKTKTIPIRKTTQVVIIHKKEGGGYTDDFAILVRGVTQTTSQLGYYDPLGGTPKYAKECVVDWADDSVTLTLEGTDTSDRCLNISRTEYCVAIIG